jgi:lysophospholipase L1-like esterase
MDNSFHHSMRFIVRLFVSFCALSWPTEFVALAKAPTKSPTKSSSTSAASAKKPTEPERFENEIAAFEKWDHQNAVPQDCILFVGSSTIRLWPTADAFPDLPVINRGFGGSTIPDVDYFADRIVFKYRPRTIVFYAGDNDIAAGHSPDKVVANYEKFAASVHSKLPDTKLIYLAIKPSPLRWKMWPQSEAVNTRVKELVNKNSHDRYVDTAPAMLGSDGQPRKELFRDDGLHMNPKGYEAWNAILAPILAR